MKQNTYIQALKKNPAASKIGSFDDSSTLLNINTPDVKQKINEQSAKVFAALPTEVGKVAQAKFMAEQDDYAYKIVHTFSASLRGIFITSSVLMAIATVLVFGLKERELQTAKPNETPGIA